MTALDQYIRLEATGRWREAGEEAWRDVVVSFGNATLVLSDFQDEPLTHWSLAATRLHAQNGPRATYVPDVGVDEMLELEDAQMIEAISQIADMVRASTHPVRARRRRGPFVLIAGAMVLATLGVVQGPDFLRNRALKLVPEDRADLIDADLRAAMNDDLCHDDRGNAALSQLARRIAPGQNVVVATWPSPPVARMPGGTILLTQGVVDAARSPEDLAGWIALGASLDRADTPLGAWIAQMTLSDTIRFLASARIEQADVTSMLTALKTRPPVPDTADLEATLARLEQADISPRTFQMSAQTALPGLADHDLAPMPPPGHTIMADQMWVALQGICAR